MNRRDLFKLLGIQILASSCSNIPSLRMADEVFISRHVENSGTDGVALITLNERLSSHQIKTNLEIHSILDTKNHLVFIPKTASSIITFSKTSKDVKEIMAPRNYFFYGHGTTIGETLYLSLAPSFESTNNRDNTAGFIAEISLTDQSPPKTYPSGGKDPHQILHSKEDNILYICNGGGKSNLASFDLQKKRIINRYFLADEFKNLSIRHLEKVNNKIYIATMCRYFNTIPTYLFTFENGNIRRLKLPYTVEKKLRIQVLSILRHDNYLFFTCPATSTVFIYNLIKNDMENTFSLLKATSLAYSKKLDGIIAGSSDPNTPLHFIQNTQNGFSLRSLEIGRNIIGEHSYTCMMNNS